MILIYLNILSKFELAQTSDFQVVQAKITPNFISQIDCYESFVFAKNVYSMTSTSWKWIFLL